MAMNERCPCRLAIMSVVQGKTCRLVVSKLNLGDDKSRYEVVSWPIWLLGSYKGSWISGAASWQQTSRQLLSNGSSNFHQFTPKSVGRQRACQYSTAPSSQ